MGLWPGVALALALLAACASATKFAVPDPPQIGGHTAAPKLDPRPPPVVVPTYAEIVSSTGPPRAVGSGRPPPSTPPRAGDAGSAAAPAPDATPATEAPQVAPGGPVNRTVSYNKPTELRFKETTQVKVILHVPTTSVASDFEGLTGAVRSIAIRVRESATAELSGPSDRVTIKRRPDFPAWQSTTESDPTWIWDVTAIAPGETNLDLTVKTKIPGAQGEVIVKSYHDVIPVRMGWVDAVKWWIVTLDPIWKSLIGVASALGAAFVWIRTQLSRKPATA